MSSALPNLPDDLPPADDLYYGTAGTLNAEQIHTEYQNDLTAPSRTERWTITNTSLADWAMRKLAEAETQIAVLTDQRNAAMERAQDWWARTVKEPQRTAAFMRGRLAEYALQVRADTKDATKTLLLPSGEVPTKKGADPKVTITDPIALTEWARKNARAIVQVSYKVNVTDLRGVAAVGTVPDPDTGEAIPAAVDGAGQPIPGAGIDPGSDEPTCNIDNIVIY